MAGILDQVDTIVILMFENRSFDQMLGYLSLAPNSSDVNGLKPPLSQYVIEYRGNRFGPYNNTRPEQPLKTNDPAQEDPPHERDNIATQLNNRNMNGFIESFPYFDPTNAEAVVMGYYTGKELPTTDFLAKNFAICDQWYSSLPAGTQPNRLMAMSGFTKIDVNSAGTLPDQELVYDWLDQRKVRWRVYHDGLPFFSMMPRMIPRIMAGKDFKSYNQLRLDVKGEDAATFPQVIFIEPRYTDAPHVDPPTDDHAPTAVKNGQDFLMRVYNDLTSNPDRWQRMVSIVTYDEHGGFYDHVPPPEIPTNPPEGCTYSPFTTLGVRVPAYIISPFAESGKVYTDPMDHCSILKLLGDKFGHGSYSLVVGARPVNTLTELLVSPEGPIRIPLPESALVGFTPQEEPEGKLPQAFRQALDTIRKDHPDEAQKRFPDLMKHF